MDLLNFIPFELGITPTPFRDTTIITYEIILSPPGKKICFNLLDDEDFKINSVIDTTQNSSVSQQIMTQSKKHVCIIDINGE